MRVDFIYLSFCPGDMFNHDNEADEPDWVKTEREQFVEFRDKNRDGKMDKEETKDWILPSDYDHAEAEARHLVYESDQNKVNTGKVNMYLLTEGVNCNLIWDGARLHFPKNNFLFLQTFSNIEVGTLDLQSEVLGISLLLDKVVFI